MKTSLATNSKTASLLGVPPLQGSPMIDVEMKKAGFRRNFWEGINVLSSLEDSQAKLDLRNALIALLYQERLNDFERLNRIGVVESSCGNFETAVNCFQHALEKYAKTPKERRILHTNIANNVLLVGKDHEKAFRHALLGLDAAKQDRMTAELLGVLTVSAYRAGRHDLVDSSIDQLISDFPNETRFLISFEKEPLAELSKQDPQFAARFNSLL